MTMAIENRRQKTEDNGWEFMVRGRQRAISSDDYVDLV